MLSLYGAIQQRSTREYPKTKQGIQTEKQKIKMTKAKKGPALR